MARIDYEVGLRSHGDAGVLNLPQCFTGEHSEGEDRW